MAWPLAAWAGVLMLRPALPDAKRFVLFLTGTALVDHHGGRDLRGARRHRPNEHRLQVLPARVGAAQRFGGRGSGLVAAGAAANGSPGWRNLFQGGTALLLVGAALYTISATTDKIRDRMAPNVPLTMDSITYMQYAAVRRLRRDHGSGERLQGNSLDAGPRAGFARDRGGQLPRVSLVHALYDLHRAARRGRLELASAAAADAQPSAGGGPRQ